VTFSTKKKKKKNSRTLITLQEKEDVNLTWRAAQYYLSSKEPEQILPFCIA